MRLSRFHLHTSKESPADAEIVSHQLMLRAGLIRRLGSGLYTWTPLGLRVLRRVETVVREEMDRAGALELLMPSIQPRELWEETGLILGKKGVWDSTPPADWTEYAATGHLPDASALQFVFRAITPPGRPRRFDARFFLIDAEALHGDIDDFSNASDELSHLQWIALEDVRKFDLPFITEVVLAEVAGRSSKEATPDSVPMFLNTEEESLFLRLAGNSPLEHALKP